MTFSGPILVTEHLILRPPQTEDLDAWADFSADPETMKFLGGPVPRPIAWRQLCTMAGSWQINGFAMFSVIERSTGDWVGRIGPWCPEGWPANEIGWGVARRFAGKGYAYEAACATMNYAVNSLGWDDIIHTIDPDNLASITLAKRLGSTNRGPTMLPPPMDTAIVDAWGQSAAQWKSRTV